MRKPVFFIILLFFTVMSVSVSGQKKIKYKDIWGLLSNKQYEAAEPFLKSYLSENDDNPNAYLYMGLIFQEKSIKDDLLKQTELTLRHIDSAIFFLNKARETITEKEIKKNEEYYQAYSRRDLRTGEFGIKLSDVQFDVEKRVEGLKEKTDRVKMVKHYFTLSDTLYKKCVAQYKKLQEPYQEQRELILRAEKNTVDDLKKLAIRFDSSMKAFEQYKGAIATVGKSGYSQVVTKREIKNLKTDGVTSSDFYQNDLQVWDYKLWAEKIAQIVEKEIFVIREHLVSYDLEINKLSEKVTKDSVSVKNDLTKLIDQLLLEKLKSYDQNPLPLAVFSVKIADLDYKSLLVEHKKYRDSVNLQLQLNLIRTEETMIRHLDSLTSVVLARDFDQEALNYQHFITNTYSNTTVLKSYLKAMKDFSTRETEAKHNEIVNIEKSMQWLIVNQTDSIPLSTAIPGKRFFPLTVEMDKFTTGLDYKDTLNAVAYFYNITPSRRPDIKISFPVDKPAFKKSQSTNARSLTYSDATGQVYYVLVYNQLPGTDKKFKATLAKIYRSDGLAWSSNLTLAFLPKELRYTAETGEFVIHADTGDTVIDKNGKLLR